MNFFNEFNSAIILTEYKKLLGDQEAIHNLHYQKAEIPALNQKLSPIKILVITEPWCGDSVAILPVIHKFFAERPVEIKIALRDQNPELIDQFLTKGGRAVPIFLILNTDGELLARFGPRPKQAQDIFEQRRQEIADGKIDKKEVIRKIRNFYAKDCGKAILTDFISVLQKSDLLGD